VLILKKNVHKPGHFHYTIRYEGKSFSCPRSQKGFTLYYMHFFILKYMYVVTFFVSAISHHISLLRLLPKSYFKISTFQPNVLCSCSFKNILICKTQCIYSEVKFSRVYIKWCKRYDKNVHVQFLFVLVYNTEIYYKMSTLYTICTG